MLYGPGIPRCTCSDPFHHDKGSVDGHRADHPGPGLQLPWGPVADQNKGYTELSTSYGGFNLRHAMQSNGRSGGSTSAVHTVSIRNRWVGKSGRIRREHGPHSPLGSVMSRGWESG